MDVLVDWLYYEPVGHIVEALKVCGGVASRHPDARITLLQNAASPTELAELAPWIDGTVSIPLREVAEQGADAACYDAIPREWDYVVHNELPQREAEKSGEPIGWMERGFRGHRAALDALITARRGTGSYFPFAVPDGLRIDREVSLRLPVPAKDREWARNRVEGHPCVVILPAGSGEACRYPSVQAWMEVLEAIQQAHPTARFYLTGRSATDDDLTDTSVFGQEQRARVVQSVSAEDLFDVGLHRQLALLERADLLISPHTGFSFLAPCVGTPWLALSGGDWCEYLFQRVPFWCNLPADPGFPHRGALETWRRTDPIPGMSDAEMRARIPGILEGVAHLVDPGFDFAAAEEVYERMLDESEVQTDRMPRRPLLRM